MNSKIYFGRIQHRRFMPRPHQLDYRLFMLYLDIDELPSIFQRFWLWSKDRKNLASFNSKDYMTNEQGDIRAAVSDEVLKQTGVKPNGPIRMLAHLRYFGHCFNPVTFYYCFDKSGDKLEFIVAQINNTPWNERHAYVLDNRNGQLQQKNERFLELNFDKDFHVSPFLPMDMQYMWRFSIPGEKLSVVMHNYREKQKIFDVTLNLKAEPINSRTLAKALLKFPMLTWKVTLGIYWHAARLWLKKIPFYDHPDTRQTSKRTLP